jgi:hypothetical protein
MNTSDVESIMRHAPVLQPPAGLKPQLIEQVQLPAAHFMPERVATPSGLAVWVRRWWPALVPAAISLACVAVISAQQIEIRNLKATIKSLSEPSAAPGSISPGTTAPPPIAASLLDASAAEQQETANLRNLIARLTAEAARLEQLAAENEKLGAQVANPLTAIVKPEEMSALDAAREKALRIKCISNLKNLGLAARTWAVDNAEVLPPDILSMTNEISSPLVLLCPADHARQAAASWAVFTPANCSYEFLAPKVSELTSQDMVAFRCPIHGTIALGDGSVPSSERPPPNSIVSRDGKLFYVPGPGPVSPPPAPNAANANPETGDPTSSPVPTTPNP